MTPDNVIETTNRFPVTSKAESSCKIKNVSKVTLFLLKKKKRNRCERGRQPFNHRLEGGKIEKADESVFSKVYESVRWIIN